MPLLSTLIQHVIYPCRRQMLLIVLLSITAQIMLLATFILPWQILQILATGHSRLDALWAGRLSPDIHARLFALISVIVGCFLSYLLCNFLMKRRIRLMSAEIIDGLNKTKLMENHRAVAVQVMTVISRLVVSAATVVLFSAATAIFYPVLALVSLACILILSVLVYRFYHYDKIPALQAALQNNTIVMMNIGLAASFIIILHDYSPQHMKFMPIFIMVMVVRQIFTAGLNMLVYLLGIHKRHQQINMLLLPRQYQTELRTTSVFEEKFSRQKLSEWLQNLFAAFCPYARQIHVAQCKLMYQGKVAHVLISYQDYRQLRPTQHYILLKCYAKAKENEARHEIDLLCNMQPPADDTSTTVPVMPTLLHSGEMPWCYYLLLDIDGNPVWKNSDERRPLLNNLRKRLFRKTLPPELIRRYDATFLSLPERMQRIQWQRLDYLTADDRTLFQLDRLISRWSDITACITRIPRCLTIHNPGMARMIEQHNELVIYCWQGWVFDTIGVHWTLTDNIAKEVRNVVNDLWQDNDFRASCSEIPSAEILISSIILAARSQEFCRRFNNKNDLGALNMIQSLLKSSAFLNDNN